MKKKIKDLTVAEMKLICFSHIDSCSDCPFYIKNTKECRKIIGLFDDEKKVEVPDIE